MSLTKEKRDNIEWAFKFALDVITLGIIPLIRAIKARREERKKKESKNS